MNIDGWVRCERRENPDLRLTINDFGFSCHETNVGFIHPVRDGLALGREDVEGINHLNQTDRVQ